MTTNSFLIFKLWNLRSSVYFSTITVSTRQTIAWKQTDRKQTDRKQTAWKVPRGSRPRRLVYRGSHQSLVLGGYSRAWVARIVLITLVRAQQGGYRVIGLYMCRFVCVCGHKNELFDTFID